MKDRYEEVRNLLYCDRWDTPFTDCEKDITCIDCIAKKVLGYIKDLEENQILKANPPIILNRGFGKTIRAKLLMFDKLKEEHDNLLKENSELKCKATPKMVTHEATIFTANTCPNCKNVVGSKEKWGESLVEIQEEYCKFCGQHLDWGNSNE